MTVIIYNCTPDTILDAAYEADRSAKFGGSHLKRYVHGRVLTAQRKDAQTIEVTSSVLDRAGVLDWLGIA